MPPNHRPGHFVVDGSNIATEGRSVPSLEQLNEAVLAFAADHPDVLLTVVVDATFGHRIDKSEVAEFDEAVANNELVAPPAGAVGRGDAFVLTIADKAGAGVLSNDSFQEFHGQYEWLFDEGRLVGGKPVPYVGWVFVDRTPVRGPKSRQAVKAAKSAGGRTSKRAAKSVKTKALATPEEAVAAKEMAKARIRPKTGAATPPVTDPETRKESSSISRTRRSKAKDPVGQAIDTGESQTRETRAPDGSASYVNELMPFLEFVSNHPVGTTCEGTIDNYASHGAYARVGDVNVYLPLRLMGSPPPRSARSVVNVGDTVTVRIDGFVPTRRSIDAALVLPTETGDDGLANDDQGPESEVVDEVGEMAPAATTRRRAKAASKPASAATEPAAKKTATKKVAAKKTVAKKADAEEASGQPTASKKAPATKASATKASAKKVAARKAPAKEAVAKKAAAKSTKPAKTTTKTTAKTTDEG